MTRPGARPLLVRGASVLATGRSDRAGLDRIERGAVLARDGVVAWVGPEPDAPEEAREADVLDARGGTIVPGFVDAHTHAVFAGDRVGELRQRLRGATYLEIAQAGGGIASTVAAVRRASKDELVASTLRRLDLMLLHGTTTAEVKSGYGLDVATEIRQLEAAREAGAAHPVDVVPTYLGAHVVPPEMRSARERYVDLVVDEALPAVAERGLAEACDVYCDAGAFDVAESRRILLRAAELGLARRIHADQLTACGGAELAAEVDAISAEHLLHASDAGLRAMADAGVVAVLLPASALFLGEAPPDVARVQEAGCRIALATDLNPGTSPTENLALVASLAAVRSRMDPDAALLAITSGGAAALGRSRAIGALEVGMACDLVVLDAPSPDHLAYRLGTNLVRHVVKRGAVVVEDGRRTGLPSR